MNMITLGLLLISFSAFAQKKVDVLHPSFKETFGEHMGAKYFDVPEELILPGAVIQGGVVIQVGTNIDPNANMCSFYDYNQTYLDLLKNTPIHSLDMRIDNERFGVFIVSYKGKEILGCNHLASEKIFSPLEENFKFVSKNEAFVKGTADLVKVKRVIESSGPQVIIDQEGQEVVVEFSDLQFLNAKNGFYETDLRYYSEDLRKVVSVIAVGVNSLKVRTSELKPVVKDIAIKNLLPFLPAPEFKADDEVFLKVDPIDAKGKVVGAVEINEKRFYLVDQNGIVRVVPFENIVRVRRSSYI